MKNLKSNRRGILFGIVGIVAVTILALVVVSAVAVWHLTEWGTQALTSVTESVSQSRQEATRAIEDAKATVATSRERAAEVLVEPQTALQRATAAATQDAARILADARATVDQTRDRAAEVLAEPQLAIDRAVDAAGQEATRSLAATAAAASAAVTAKMDSVTRAVTTVAGRDPQLWPSALPVRQVGFREAGAVAEYTYVAESDGFQVSELRRELLGLGYAEQVIGERDGSLEALYRADRQLLVEAATRDGRLHIEVRETPLAAEAAP